MSPTLSFLLTLSTLISQAISLNIPAPTFRLTNIINAENAGVNPLPPAPTDWYHIPDTTLSMKLLPPLPPPNPFLLPSILSALTSARLSIASFATHHLPLPYPYGWSFTDPTSHVSIRAGPPFPNLGTYKQLASALLGLAYLTEEGGARGGEVEWVLADEVQGVVMRGRLGAGVGAGGGGGGGNVTATGSVVGATMATKTQSVSIVGVEELDSS